ncbi:alpha/beta hydrolase [Actinomadura sp. ATCC 31491]|uniref:Alpha/beta hydrolase n=1 Tax=Actinomadura luzonensis TaxID=2805427 RepID=A0ABT0FXK2_9ACTN|nr:alpha/beta hydrolase [Actinomadura luzonensis]MCK2216675.1 alpha/beta hydrolase [Actinomadura luzonensis]
MDTGTLPVPGAELYYEVRGTGPVLLTILGGGTDAAMAGPLAAALAARYTVVTYDRRGFTRSPLTGPPAAQRLADHADDALRLIDACDLGPANVFATHSGALIGLDLLARHPGRVRRLVAHEPPAFELLPDAARWRRLAEEAAERCRREGVAAAARVLGEQTGVSPPPEPDPGLPEWVRAMLTRMAVNMETSLLYEQVPFVRHVPDLAALRAAPPVLACGADTSGLMRACTLALAGLLDVPVVELPGDHAGYLRDPAGFGAALRGLLEA